jgi:asparagine synthase (glutamine-hydrolysing)
MHSADGRYVIVYNGEIYNYKELRADLEAKGFQFRTSSDTEVILTLFSVKGESMLSSLRGMFAFVIWDQLARRAFIARDAYGIKPLYYARSDEGIAVGSQVTSLIATGNVSREPDVLGRASFWLLGSVAEPRTWYRDVASVPAGHYTWIVDGEISTPVCWQDIRAVWRSAPQHYRGDQRMVADQVASAVLDSVKAHLVADVPVGVFLSGGIDSGAIAGLMAAAGASDLTGVTLSFAEYDGLAQDEVPAAREVARTYGIRHTVRRVSKREFVADLPAIVKAMDQPSVDGINTWYASKAMKELGLKVVASGVGGDELFQGYSTFEELPRLVASCRVMTSVGAGERLARFVCERLASRTRNPRWRLLPRLGRDLPGAWFLRRSLFSLDELPDLMGPDLAKEALDEIPNSLINDSGRGLSANPRLGVGELESSLYLRNQLLRDSDWASMDHSVELRTPLVDSWLLRRLAPFLAALDVRPKKLHLALSPRVPLPAGVINKKKTGFSIPVSAWGRENIAGVARVASDRGLQGWARFVAQSYCAENG